MIVKRVALITINCFPANMKKSGLSTTKKSPRDSSLASRPLEQGRCNGISYFNCKDLLNSRGILNLTVVDEVS